MDNPLEDVAYNVDEAFEIAGQIERNGAAFYREAAEKVDSEQAAEMFLALAVREDEHERVFDALRKQIVSHGDEIASYDSDELVVSYLRAIAGQYVFNLKQKPEALFEGDVSVPDVLRAAIQKEKDSIILYVGMRQAVSDNAIRERLGIIMREEQRHLVDLSGLLNEIESERSPI